VLRLGLGIIVLGIDSIDKIIHHVSKLSALLQIS